MSDFMKMYRWGERTVGIQRGKQIGTLNVASEHHQLQTGFFYEFVCLWTWGAYFSTGCDIHNKNNNFIYTLDSDVNIRSVVELLKTAIKLVVR